MTPKVASPSVNELRPATLDEYTGQPELVSRLRIAIKSALLRNDALEHILLSGPPGLGKTSCAMVLAHEMQSTAHLTHAPALRQVNDLLPLLRSTGKCDILFIDEIHRLPMPVAEALYSVMEDFTFQTVEKINTGRQHVSLAVPPFTVVGATTQPGKISGPMRDRFGIHIEIEFYPDEALTQIVLRSARELQVKISVQAAEEVAKRARGTPRIANTLLKRSRDWMVAAGLAMISRKEVASALRLEGVDSKGLTKLDHQYLECLHRQFKGGPAGVEALASALAQSVVTLEDMVEPYLLRLGKIARTHRGRIELDER